MEFELKQLGWPAFFIKDYVKSVKTGTGSVVRDPLETRLVIEEMLRVRDNIEGGFCVRRVEHFIEERRYFVLNGKIYGKKPKPSIVSQTLEVQSNFFSIDVAITTAGAKRIVELGDGQVSDLVGWTIQEFFELDWSSAKLRVIKS